MASYERFEDLEVWQESKKLVRAIHGVSQEGAFAKNFALRDQVQRASISVMSNIAEGFERAGNREFTHFLYMRKVLRGEVRSQIYVAFDLGYIDEAKCNELQQATMCVSRQLSGFIKYLNRAGANGTARRSNAKI